jgi:transcriptional regulator
MHLPSSNVEKRPQVLHEFIRQNPLGIFTTAIQSASYPFLQSSHIPWIIDTEFEESKAGLGRLRGHIARQNPQAKAIIDSFDATAPSSVPSYLPGDVLVLFNGPVHHYVTPKFYKQTKPSTGKVVPTWDYEAVEVYGKARVYFDTKSELSGAFIAKQIDNLSEHMETVIMEYGKANGIQPWKVSDAPPRYLELMMKNIIGIEIEITSMAGRFKWSQEKPPGDRIGVIEGFKDMNKAESAQLAEKVAERAAIFDGEKAAKTEATIPSSE